MARGLLTWHLIRSGWLQIVVTRDVQPEYVNALEWADDGDLAPFVGLLVQLEEETLKRALRVGHEGCL